MILAPIIVFYTNGTRFNFDDNEYVSTGILSVDTNPSDATVMVGGEERGKTPVSVRFLTENEYAISLAKDGYFSWEKRLPVKANRVTWASVDIPKVYLLKKSDAVAVSSGILDSIQQDGTIIALSSKTLTITNENNPKELQTITLPEQSTKIIDARGSSVLVSGQTKLLLVNLGTKAVIELPKNISPEKVIWFDETKIMYIENTVLNKFDTVTGRKETLLTNCIAATSLANDIYTISNEQGKLTLHVHTFNQSSLIESHALLENIPTATNLSIFVSSGKEIFLQENDTLYRIDESLTAIARGVTATYSKSGSNELVFTTSSELLWYDPNNGITKLITRFSTPVSAPIIRTDIGYAFFGQGPELVALELDARDRQNRYTLAKVTSAQAIHTDNSAQQISFIDNGTLNVLQIRN